MRNTRLTYTDSNSDGTIDPATEILREQNYYPFGLEHKGYNNVIIGAKNNLKQYQGQEFTEDLGLNTHEWRYRVSDPAIGRFWQIDPLAEKYMYNSTYAFQENKLGSGVELEGLENVDWEQQQYFEMSKEVQGVLAEMASYIDKAFASFTTTSTKKVSESTGSNGEVSNSSTVTHSETTKVSPNLEDFIRNIRVSGDGTGTAVMPDIPLVKVEETESVTASNKTKVKVNVRGPVSVSEELTNSTNLLTNESSTTAKIGLGIDKGVFNAGGFISVKESEKGTKVTGGVEGSIKNSSTNTTTSLKIGISHEIK